MQSSLGIYIEDNLIKYAKLQKDKESIRVENYNIAFYDNDLEATLKRIISETYSYKVPVSINVSNEIYNTFMVPALLSKQDTKKAINIEYEMLCSEKGYNKNLLDNKYLLVDQKEDPERLKALNVTVNKTETARRVDALSGSKVSTITPITTSIANLINIDGRQNIVIVNIEDKTKITTIIDGQIYQIDVLDDGMGRILNDINKIENSYSKSYEVCKNMTIYTQNSTELYSESSEYMDIVTGVLYQIVAEVKRIITGFFSGIDKIYLTGLGTSINNIDLFFQEYITEARCEILKPYFVNTSSMQIPIKEYIEVNSAIALALDGLGMVNKQLNFSKSAKSEKSKMNSVLSTEIDLNTIKNYFIDFGRNLKKDFTAPLQSSDRLLIRGIFATVILAVIFVLLSSVITKQIDSKKEEVMLATQEANKQLDKIDSDINTISTRTIAYNNLITEITAPDTNETNTAKQRIVPKDAIPNLLNRIMFVIPKRVKLTSIQNVTSTHIVIKAEAEKYEQLGYFKAVLSTNGILKNVKSTSGQKVGSVVEVTIEGDLP